MKKKYILALDSEELNFLLEQLSNVVSVSFNDERVAHARALTLQLRDAFAKQHKLGKK